MIEIINSFCFVVHNIALSSHQGPTQVQFRHHPHICSCFYQHALLVLTLLMQTFMCLNLDHQLSHQTFKGREVPVRKRSWHFYILNILARLLK